MRAPECAMCEKWTKDFCVYEDPITDQMLCEDCYFIAVRELEEDENNES